MASFSSQSDNSSSFLDSTQFHYSKEVLLNEHNSFLSKIPLFGSTNFPREQIQTGKIVDLKMQAIGIKELFPNLGNINKYIYSKQISRIAECETIRFIIEDENGNACRVSIPGHADTSKLKMGVKLAFCNPNYRILFDGKYSLIVSIISNIFRIEEFPFEISPSPVSLQSAFTLQSTPSSIGSPPFAFGRQEVSSTQSTLIASPLKKANESESTFQFRGPYHSLPGEAKPIGPEQQQQQQQQPSEEDIQSQCCIDLPQSPEIGHGDADTLNSAGMKLFEEGRYLEAIMKYTSAIQTRDKVSEYFYNRAMCYFNMDYFEIALSDFQKASSITPNSVKYQYWIALTWSKIGNHKVSLDVLTKMKSIPKRFLGPVESLKSKEKMIVENTNGKFDFDMLRQNVIDSRDNEIGDYIGPIQIQKSVDKGRGIITTRKVLKGQNLCVVKAIEFLRTPLFQSDCHDCERELFRKFSGKNRLHFNLKGKASKSKLTTVRLISLCDRSINKVNIDLYSGHGNEFASNYDTTKYPLHKLESLAEENLSVDFEKSNLSFAFGITYASLTQLCYGFWLVPSFINHSCIPNVVKLFIDDICIIRAITDISEGDEIFCSYVPLVTFPSVESRRKFLEFKCNCELCKFETNPDFLDTISQIISLNNYLDTFLPAVICFVQPLHQKRQPAMKQTFSQDKWLEIRDKLLNFAKILRLNEVNHHISVAFLNSLICLLQTSFSQQDALDFALKAEHYFSQFEPGTYMSFWNGFYLFLKKLDLLKHPRFKHVEAKYNQARELFT